MTQEKERRKAEWENRKKKQIGQESRKSQTRTETHLIWFIMEINRYTNNWNGSIYTNANISVHILEKKLFQTINNL